MIQNEFKNLHTCDVIIWLHFLPTVGPFGCKSLKTLYLGRNTPLPCSIQNDGLAEASLVVRWLRICLQCKGCGFDPWESKITSLCGQLRLDAAKLKKKKFLSDALAADSPVEIMVLSKIWLSAHSLGIWQFSANLFHISGPHPLDGTFSSLTLCQPSGGALGPLTTLFVIGDLLFRWLQ